MQRFDVAGFIDRLAGHGRALGIVHHAHGPDWAALAMPWHACHADSLGPVTALVDMAGSVAVWLARGGFEPQATLDLRVDRLRAPVPGRAVIGRVECHRLAGAVAFVRGVGHGGDAADPFVQVTGTYMRLVA